MQTNLTKEISELGFAALEITEADEFKHEVLTRMQGIFSAPDSLMIDWSTVAPRQQEWGPRDMYSPNWQRDYNKYYYRNFLQDPIYKWMQSGRYKSNLSVTRFSQLVTIQDFRKTQLFSELMQPLKYRHILTIVLNDGKDIVSNISLLRPKDLHDFSAQEIQVAQTITPMIISAYRNIALEQQCREHGDMLDVLHAHAQTPWLAVLSEDLRLEYLSEETEELLATLKPHGITSIQGLLMRSRGLKKYTDTFRTAQASCYKRLPTQFSEVIKVDKTLHVHTQLTLHKQQSGKYYLVVTLSQKSDSKPKASFQETFKLTMREVQVAQLASEGLTCEGISEQLCISKWSVKTHLKHIYTKTGVNNRAALCCLIR